MYRDVELDPRPSLMQRSIRFTVSHITSPRPILSTYASRNAFQFLSLSLKLEETLFKSRHFQMMMNFDVPFLIC